MIDFLRMLKKFVHQLQNRTIQRLSSQSAYRRWAESYPPSPHNPLMELEQQAMLHLMPDLSGRRVLDLACGTGRYGTLAVEAGGEFVLGIDDSPAMLDRAHLSMLSLGSMSQIPIQSACMDVVICGLAVGHLPDLASILAEISRVLVDGGQAVLSDFHPFQYLHGARRTFRDRDQIYEVEHYPHLYETWHKGCDHAGLRIDRVVEPCLNGQSAPVVIVYRLVKA